MKESVVSPISPMILFIVSVISSGVCLAMYSFIASLKSWLLDFLVLFANLSAFSKMSSGIEIAVFIPQV